MKTDINYRLKAIRRRITLLENQRRVLDESTVASAIEATHRRIAGLVSQAVVINEQIEKAQSRLFELEKSLGDLPTQREVMDKQIKKLKEERQEIRGCQQMLDSLELLQRKLPKDEIQRIRDALSE